MTRGRKQRLRRLFDVNENYAFSISRNIFVCLKKYMNLQEIYSCFTRVAKEKRKETEKASDVSSTSMKISIFQEIYFLV